MSEMMQVPDGWEVKPLNTYTKLITKGSTPTTYGYNFKDNGINFIKAESINKFGNIDVSEIQFIDEETHHFLKRSQLKQGDLLFSIAGVLGRVTILKKEDLPANTNQALSIIRLKENSGKYLYYFLQSHFILSQIQSLNVQMAQANLSLENLNNFQIIIPKEKKEQEEIAKILSTLDKAIESSNCLIEKEKHIKTALMQELLTNGIDQKEQIRSPQTHTYKPSELELIPDEWEVVSLREITKAQQGLQIAITDRKETVGNNSYPYITIQYLKNNKVVEYIEDPKKSVLCSHEDILMARTGNTGIVVTNVSGVFHNNFFRVDFDRTKIDKTFFVYFLESPKVQLEIQSKAGVTTIPDLNHSDFYSIEFMMMGIEEQKQIARILSTQDKKIETEETNLAKLKELKKGLMNDLLSGKVRVKV